MKRVQKVKPLKKINERDNIFEKLHEIHKETDDDTVLRISIDSKATVKIGNYSRNGKSRNGRKALDHDFIVDIIEDYWTSNRDAFSKIQTLIINSDNGSENSSRRTQFIKRIVEFSNKYSVIVKLVYYTPYHSKYNPIERIWAALEKHWNENLLNSEDTFYNLQKL